MSNVISRAIISSEMPGHLGGIWRDTSNVPLQAHGGCVLEHEGLYYWYGEDKGAPTEIAGICGWRTPALGVRCYSSCDLSRWTDEGRVLSTSKEDPTADLHPANVVERPKVLYHAASGTFVMWIHIDRMNYDLAAVGVAVADQPTGPFRFLASFRPGGADSRDFTVFAHADEAWLFHSAEGNKTMHVRKLSNDWRSLGDAAYSRIFPGEAREAPAVFYAKERFWMLTSGCSGWDPNEARLAVADAPMGPWTLLANPCRGGDNPELTWRAQSAFVFERRGAVLQHIAMFDRWTKTDLGDSRYVWIPVSWLGESPIIDWELGKELLSSS